MLRLSLKDKIRMKLSGKEPDDNGKRHSLQSKQTQVAAGWPCLLKDRQPVEQTSPGVVETAYRKAQCETFPSQMTDWLC